MDTTSVKILNLLIALGILLLPFFIFQKMTPTPYRLVMHLMRSMGKGMWRLGWKTHYERRGLLFALWHTLVVCAILATIGSVNSGANWVAPATLWAAVILVKWLINRLRKLRSSRHALPSRRRW